MLSKTSRKQAAAGSSGKAATMHAWILAAVLLLTGCDGKKTACKEAVRAYLKNPESYRALKIEEQYGEGAAFNDYIVEYSYSNGTDIIHGKNSCLYDNNGRKAYTEVPMPQF